MKIKSNYKGFTLIELIVVAGIAAIVIGIGSFAITSKFAMRRSVDQVGEKINASLQIAKVRAARQGVEYCTVLSFDSNEHILTIETKRGDSNVGSTDYFPLEPESIQNLKVLSDYNIIFSNNGEIIPSNIQIKFDPEGVIEDVKEDCSDKDEIPPPANVSIAIDPIVTSSQIFKCGEVAVSSLGRISFTIGNYNDTDKECKPILDDEAVP